jgi:hypothetical protein
MHLPVRLLNSSMEEENAVTNLATYSDIRYPHEFRWMHAIIGGHYNRTILAN